MTVADEIQKLQTNLSSSYSACQEKGATLPESANFDNLPATIGSITGGGTKFGATINTFLGDIDENGVLNKLTWTSELDFTGVKKIESYALSYTFHGNGGVTGVNLSSVTDINNYGLYFTFYNCIEISYFDLSSLTSVGTNGLYNTFSNCKKISVANLGSLVEVSNYGLNTTFSNCSGIKSVDFSSLAKIGTSGFQYAFSGCTGLSTLSFPSLTSVATNSFGSSEAASAFKGCTGITEIHFRADMQSTIEAMTQYENKWGATNATIYFDL